jgi:hypothetical protein
MLFPNGSKANYFVYALPDFGSVLLCLEFCTQADWTYFECNPVDLTSLSHSFICGELYLFAEWFLLRCFFSECYFLSSSQVFDLTNGCFVSFDIGFI